MRFTGQLVPASPYTIGQRFGAAFFKKNVRLSSPNFLCGSALFLKRRHDDTDKMPPTGRHLVQSEGSFLFALIQVLQSFNCTYHLSLLS